MFVVVLAIFAVVLLFIPKKKDQTQIEQVKTELKVKGDEELQKIIPREIDTILFSFGIKKEWIGYLNTAPDKKTKSTDKKETGKKEKNKEKKVPVILPNVGSLWFHKEVTLPLDLPVVEINYEINNFLNTAGVTTSVQEDAKSKNVYMSLMKSSDSSKKVFAKIDFVYSDKNKRDASKVCIVLSNLENISPGDLKKILGSTEKFSVILPDDIDNTAIQSDILESKKDYLLYFDTGTDDNIEADFRTDMKEKEWKSKIKSLCYEYTKASGMIIENKVKDMTFVHNIQEEFLKYIPTVFRDTVMIKFTSKETGEKKIHDLFSDILTRTAKGNKNLIYLLNFTTDDFTNYTKEVHNLKKRGYRFMKFNEMIEKKNNEEE